MAREIPYIAAVNEAIRARDGARRRPSSSTARTSPRATRTRSSRRSGATASACRRSPRRPRSEWPSGLALAGYRPVVELLMAEFMLVAMDQVVNEAPRFRYMSGGQVKVPLVLKAGYGFTAGWAGQHTGSIYDDVHRRPRPEGRAAVDARRRQGADGERAIRDDNPVVYLIHYLLVLEHGDVPEGEYLVPFGEAAVRRAGHGRDDRRHRLDGRPGARGGRDARRRGHRGRGDRPAHARSRSTRATILASVEKTGRLVLADQATRHGRRLGGDRRRGRRARLLVAEGADQAGHRARRDDPLQRADGGVRAAQRGARSPTRSDRCWATAPAPRPE